MTQYFGFRADWFCFTALCLSKEKTLSAVLLCMILPTPILLATTVPMQCEIVEEILTEMPMTQREHRTHTAMAILERSLYRR